MEGWNIPINVIYISYYISLNSKAPKRKKKKKDGLGAILIVIVSVSYLVYLLNRLPSQCLMGLVMTYLRCGGDRVLVCC